MLRQKGNNVFRFTQKSCILFRKSLVNGLALGLSIQQEKELTWHYFSSKIKKTKISQVTLKAQ